MGHKVKPVEVVDDKGNVSPIVNAGKPCSIEIEFVGGDGYITAHRPILVMDLKAQASHGSSAATSTSR